MPREIIDHKAEIYTRKFTSELDAVLAKNEQWTQLNHPHAQMHSGQVQGKVLEMLSMMVGPQKILEIGTFTGFSALCLCKGLAAGGVLHTIELREEDAAVAQSYFSEAGLSGRIRLHIGNAL